MKIIKSIFCMLTIFSLSTAILYAEELRNHVSFSVGGAKDIDSDSNANLTATWGYGHTADFWQFDAGVQIQDELADATAAIGIFASYCKDWPVQPGTSIGLRYHLQQGNNIRTQDGLVTASFFLDFLPIKTRITAYGGLVLKHTRYLKLAAEDDAYAIFPVFSVFLTQTIIPRLELRLGVSSFSYYSYTEWISPTIFGDVTWSFTPKLSATGGMQFHFKKYDTEEPLERDSYDFSAGIKYAY